MRPLALTLGDPAGIGPEIVVGAWRALKDTGPAFFVVGDARAVASAPCAGPGLVRSMSVLPPRGTGRVRLLKIDDVDLQPCGGTHVANTAEIGPVIVTKIEKKSAMTRRVVLGFARPDA